MLQNFPLFSDKSTANLICTSVWLLYSRPCHLLIMQPIFLVQGQCYRQIYVTKSILEVTQESIYRFLSETDLWASRLSRRSAKL